MFDPQIFDALTKTHERIKSGDQRFDQTNPTDFVRIVLGELSIENPEEFHAHTVTGGQGLPAERPHGTEDREIYFLKLDGSMEYHFLTGQRDGLSASTLKETASCCHCEKKCCVIEVDI